MTLVGPTSLGDSTECMKCSVNKIRMALADREWDPGCFSPGATGAPLTRFDLAVQQRDRV